MLKSSDGHSVTLDDQAKKVTIQTVGKLSITLDDSVPSITLSGGGRTITMSGGSVNIT